MASTTATARAVLFSRITTLSAKPLPPSLSRFFRKRPNRPFSALTVSCLNSGGVCDDDYFVSTQKSNLDRGLYTLWNAEYRVSLMRNLERAAPGEEVAGETEEAIRQRPGKVFEEKKEERASQSDGFQEFEKIRPRVSGELSPEALKYIEKLQAELSDAVEVTELSQPSSVQVEETIHQLVQNILQRPFKNELKRDSGIANKGNNHQDVADETSGTVATVGTSRDYLAKLLFWLYYQDC
ncbi:pks32 [Gossypium australe]|uniref:Pks32 n=1 Tax=Gossypium australe TaxID=47621 RepID=A0A5B6V5G3_9ROSI|nr:pks32 [Gossypium australe]